MQTALDCHLAAINSGRVTKTNVIGIRKAINHVERIANGWSGNRSNATSDDVVALERELAWNNPIVIGELHDSSLKVLRSPRYAKRFTAAQREIIASDSAFFRLVRFDRIGDRGMHAVPVYNIYSPKAGGFLFRNIPWQSGGNGPEVLA